MVNKKVEQTAFTTARLIEIARAHFARDGYAHAATEAIVHEAGVTRGALYHHFGSKEGLFRAVLDHLNQELVTQIEQAADTPDSWEQLVRGCRAFLRFSTRPDAQRILFIDAPAVIGWETWHANDQAYGQPTLYSIVTLLLNEGRLRPLPADALVHLLNGALNEAALWIASADDPERALTDAITAFEGILDGLRLR